MSTEAIFRAKVRTGAFLFRYGYLDLETVIDRLDRYAKRIGVTRELGAEAVKQIVWAALANIPLEQPQ